MFEEKHINQMDTAELIAKAQSICDKGANRTHVDHLQYDFCNERHIYLTGEPLPCMVHM